MNAVNTRIVEKVVFLPAIAATLGSILAKKVGFGGVFFKEGLQTAMTTGNVVYLPMFSREGGEEAGHVLRCFLAHEILGHVHNTDFAALRTWKKSAKPSPFTFGLWNTIEDARIEMAAWSTYPKVKNILENGVVVLDKKHGFFGEDVPDPTLHPARIVSLLLLRVLRGERLKQPLDTSGIRKLAAMSFGSDVRDKIIEMALAGANAPSGKEGTLDTIKAAEEITQYLKGVEEERKRKEEEREREKKAQEQQKQDQEQQNGTGEAGDQDGSDAESQSDGGGDEDLDAEEDGASQTITDVLGADEDEMGATDIAEAAKQSGLIKAPQGSNEAARTAESSRLITNTQSVDGMVPTVAKTTATYTPTLESMAATQKLASKLERLLQSKVSNASRLSDSGRLDGRRLPNAMMGDSLIFRVRGKEKEGLNTAIALILDRSGSMSGTNMTTAVDTCYAVSSALAKFESQGLGFSVSCFNQSMEILKEWGKPWNNQKNNMSVVKAGGSTYFQPTLLEACKGLAVRKELRKIAYFITDGDIGTEARSVISTILSEGIEIRCVLIDTDRSYSDDEAKDLFSKSGVTYWAIARTSLEIPQAVFAGLQDAF